ncbi:DinB family protein [Lentiprolixibacter aurantiacus]|uniref:DinB family protein n=1 Tax=Lentiprolixibacter aurantiacus TaxID=2993939 RepID=A0AAE3MJT4_9FLAO|nr:DinB family protein [Lentiprolixibacter aurantiacus]MCX2718432.1 DinB family protein [Lentiprolixibacter aurantiacus]
MKQLCLLLFCLSGLLAFAQNPTIDHLVADFERGKTLSLAYVDAMPEDQFNFKPTPETMSFAEQMLHTAQGTFGLSSNASGAENPYAGQNLQKDESLHSKAEVKRLLAESFDFAIAGTKNMDPAQFEEVVERWQFKVTRLGWMQKTKEHIDHHRGQTAVYLRLAGITPPQYQLF